VITALEVTSTTRFAAAWRNAYIVLGCCLGLLVLLYWPTAGSVRRTWSQDPFAHAYFAVAAAGYLAWSRRARVESTNWRPAFVALPLLGLCSFVWLLGDPRRTSHLQELCLATMGVGLTWSVLGTTAMRVLIFPLGLLLFALPFGERLVPALVPALQEFTARFALKLLTLSGVQAVLDGYAISIADDRWLVSDACGGINYLTASLVVGYLYAGTVYREWRHRVAFLVASALVPLVANGLRVYATILLDYAGATTVVAGMGHYMFGLFVFGIIMSVLFIVCGRWRDEPSSADDPMSVPEGRAAAGSPPSAGRLAFCATLAMLLVAAGPVSARALRHQPALERTIRQTSMLAVRPLRNALSDSRPAAR
jgi:exosortase A